LYKSGRAKASKTASTARMTIAGIMIPNLCLFVLGPPQIPQILLTLTLKT
jgi:hypothetical protein